MAEVIDLGARQREMYLNMYKNMFSGSNDDVSREIDRQAEQDLRERQFQEQQKMNQERMGMERDEHSRKVAEYNQTFGLRQQEADMNDWKAKDQSTQDWLKTQAVQNDSNATVKLRTAQTDESKAHAELDRQDTIGKKWWLNNQIHEGATDDARRIINEYRGRAANGDQFSRTDSNRLEWAMQTYYGDTNMRIPRDESGSWAPDRSKIQNMQIGKDGTISGKYADELRTGNRAYTPMGQAMQDFDKLAADPSTPPEKIKLAAQAVKNLAYRGMPDPTKRYLDDALNASPQAFIDGLRQVSAAKASGQAEGRLKIPSSKDISDLNASTYASAHLRQLADQIPDIYDKHGYLPAGLGARTAAEYLNQIGMIDPQVMLWKKELDNAVLENIFHYTGKRWNPNEADLARKGFPNPMEDPPEVLQASLYRFADIMEEKTAMQYGMMKSMGYRVPEEITDPNTGEKKNVPIIMPQDVHAALHENPPYNGDTGDLTAEYTGNMARGAFKLSRLMEAQRKRTGQDIGGIGSFRPSARPDPTATGATQVQPPWAPGFTQTAGPTQAAPPQSPVLQPDAFSGTPGEANVPKKMFKNEKAYEFWKKHINQNAELEKGTE